MKNLMGLVGILVIVGNVNAAVIADFDDLSLAVNSHWSGLFTVDGTGGSYDTSTFSSGSATFENHSDGDWGLWAGFAYSNEVDTATGGFTNQFSTYTGHAHGGSNFGVGYQDGFNGFNPHLTLSNPTQVAGVYVTNTTYAALDMSTGSQFSKSFGGLTGNDEDWFMLTITGKDQTGVSVGSVDFYLADYRFADNNLDYIVDTWEYVDLSSLGAVSVLEFTLSSSDSGAFGMNTPAYFAVDTIVPEPATLALFSIGALMLRRKK